MKIPVGNNEPIPKPKRGMLYANGEGIFIHDGFSWLPFNQDTAYILSEVGEKNDS